MYPRYYISLNDFFDSLGFGGHVLSLSVTLTLWLAVFVIASTLYWIMTRPLGTLLMRWSESTRTKWDNLLIRPQLIRAVGLALFCLILMRFLPSATLYYPGSQRMLGIVLKSIMTLSVAHCISTFAHTLYDACLRQKLDIHGLIVLRNVVSSAVYIVAILIIVSMLLNRNITYILSGLGAMAAVLSLVFKDTILGVVAGVKLSLNRNLKNGDWIQVPAFGANGEVVDVTLSTIKVRNWDNSIVSLPPYALISGGFQNQQEMKRSGGRRIARSFHIDVNSVRYLSAEECEAFASQPWAEDIDMSKPMVNLTLFRRYLERHILQCKGFRHDMLNMVRELQPTAEGIPVEIYLFTSDVDWKQYEMTQADLFDTVIASVRLFGLRLFQHPTGKDLKQLVISN